jgi:hypothetical protein
MASLKAAGRGSLLARFCLLAAVEPSRGDDGGSSRSFFSAVSDYFRDWFKRAAKTQAEQPHWVTPLVTVTPRLEQELRYDQLWQNRSHGQTLNSFGAGLELIPAEKIEVILGFPAWQARNTRLAPTALQTRICS